MNEIETRLAAAERENAMLKKLVALQQENIALRLSLQMPDDDDEVMARIIGLVCLEFNVSDEQLRGPVRTERLVLPRHAAFWLLREMTPLSCQVLGKYFERHHTTVLAGVADIQNRLNEPRYRGRLESVRAKARTLLGRDGEMKSESQP